MTAMTDSAGRPRKLKLPDKLPYRIRELRTAQRMSLAELARRTEFNAQTIHRYETGERDIPAQRLEKIAKALGVTLQDVLNPEAAPGTSMVPSIATRAAAVAASSDVEAEIEDAATTLALAISDAAGGLGPREKTRVIREVRALVQDFRRRFSAPNGQR